MRCLNKILLCILLHCEFGMASEQPGPVKCILSPQPVSAVTLSQRMFSLNVSSSVNVSSDGTLKFTVIDTKPEFETIIHFISTFFHSSRAGSGCSEVVGVVGDVDFKTASILHTLASRSNFTLTLVAAVAPSTFLPVTNLVLPNLLDIHPLSHYIETIVSFIDEWKWSRIGLIRDDTLYYQYVAEMLFTKLAGASKTITPNFTVRRGVDILKQVREYGTYIFVLCMRTEIALLLLNEAQELGYSWPEYAWIVFSVDSDPDTFAGSLEGTFVTRDNIFKTAGVLKFICSNSGSNSLNISLPDVIKFREGKRLSNISVVQLANSPEYELEIAYYDPELKQLNVVHNLSALGNIPRGSTVSLELVYSTVEIAAILVAVTCIVVFVTAILAFYIYFRNEPEIKATSFSVSLSMFLGCYLLVAFVPFLLISYQPDGYLGFNGDIICKMIVILCGIAVPSVLILAALFIKMLRVYAIFLNPYSYKQKFFSDAFLFLYILLILLPTVLILIVWMAPDPFKNTSIAVPKKSHLLLLERCESKHTAVWIGLLVLYTFAVTISVAILAFKSSKIRYKNFRDTKATNAFAFLKIFAVLIGTMYWFFYRNLRLSSSSIANSYIPLYVIHFVLPLLCQVFLFVPKVYPPLKRHLTKNIVKSKRLAK